VRLDPWRLRSGEWIIAISSVLLAISLLTTWYALSGPLAQTGGLPDRVASFDGWHALTVTRWLIVLTSLCGFAVIALQLTRRAPALPVGFTIVLLALSFLTALAVTYRVVFHEPAAYGPITQRFGAFVGMFSALGVLAGAYRSLRQDGILPEDGPQEIETIHLA
jgi:heme/copper-type cytochrome/quinol oxidase subunit 3